MNNKGIAAEQIHKMHEGRPNIADAITNKQIDLVVNTPASRQSQHDDSYIRKTAIKHKIPYITTLLRRPQPSVELRPKRRGNRPLNPFRNITPIFIEAFGLKQTFISNI